MRMRRPYIKYASVATFLMVFWSALYAGPFDGCVEYVKLGVPGTEGTPLCRKGYALSHDPDTKTPYWVAEHLTREKVVTAMVRKNDFRADPDLEEGERAELSDYIKSGYDRGHMAPAGDMRWDEQAMSESFLLSNMSPQVGIGFNRGIWKDLEEDIRNWAKERGELYIYTGPIYEGDIKRIGKDKVGVPAYFYKIVYDPIRVEAIVFILPNEKLKASDLPKYIATVQDVEQKTKLKFFSELNSRIHNIIESEKADALWQ